MRQQKLTECDGDDDDDDDTYNKMCQDSLISRVTRLWDVRSRFDSRQGKILHSSKSLPDRIRESLIHLLITGVFNMGINRTGRVGDYSPPPSSKNNKVCSYSCTPYTPAWYGD